MRNFRKEQDYSGAKCLWENREALNKYLTKLEELMSNQLNSNNMEQENTQQAGNAAMPGAVPYRPDVVVRLGVNHIKKTKGYGKAGTLNTEIMMSIVYTGDPTNPNHQFEQLSGGTEFKLSTVNEDAAAIFDLCGEYEVIIRRVK